MGVAARGMERRLPNDIPFDTKGNKQAEVMRMFMKIQEEWNKLPGKVLRQHVRAVARRARYASAQG